MILIFVNSATIEIIRPKQLQINDVVLFGDIPLRISDVNTERGIGEEFFTKERYTLNYDTYRIIMDKPIHIRILCWDCGESIQHYTNIPNNFEELNKTITDLAKPHRCYKKFYCKICKSEKLTRVYHEEKDEGCGCGIYYNMVYECPDCHQTATKNQCRKL